MKMSSQPFLSQAHSMEMLEIFFSEAENDKSLSDELEKSLASLLREGMVSIWRRQSIGAGTEGADQIKTRLNAAQIILLLISPDFMSSDHCYKIEMQHALRRHDDKEAKVIPVLLRPTD